MKPALVLAALLAAAGVIFPQSQIGSGDLRGVVTDPAGAVIANTKVTAVDIERGTTRTAQTDDQGEFRFPLLPPGNYRIRVEAPGFATKLVDNAQVHVGETLVLRIPMEVGAVTTEITVAADAPIIEAERTQQATSIDSRRINNLPINRRNYLDFALLAPAVVETNDIVDGTDFRVAQAPHSGLSFGGGNGRGNAFFIDGVANYFNSGGVRPSVSQEVVREFQVNRNSYSAEYGGATGGAINIISKSGTNEVHGNLFGFLRHRGIQARNYFDPEKSAFTRAQYGATFSAPVARDRTFFFAGFERLDRQETAFVPILQDRSVFTRLTPSQQQLADFFDAAPVPQLRPLGAALRRALIPSNYPATVALFDRNSGNFPFSEDVTQFSVRLDHQFTDNDRFFVRGSLTNSFNENAQFGALVAFNRGRSIDQFDGALMMSNTYVMSPRWVTESRAMFGYNKLDVVPKDPLGPEINITGYGFFGREIFLPSRTLERHYQFQQLFDFSSGRHNVKFGADINPVRDAVNSETFFSGRFTFGEAIPLGLLLTNLQGDPNAATVLGQTLAALGQQRLIPNLSQPITALQAYNLGLPVLYQQGFGDPNWIAWFKRYGFFVQDSIKVAPTLTLNLGARYELDDTPEPVRTDKNNIAPRVGLAWNPDNNKTVIRAGFGLFYGLTYAQVANLPATLDGVQIAQAFLTIRGIPGLNNPRTGQPLTSADIYQTLAAQGVIGRRSITREDIAQFGLRPGPNAPGRVLFGIVDDFVSPYSQQASLEIERAFGQFAVSAGYTFLRGAHLVRNLDRNLFYAGRRPDDQPIFGFKDPTILQQNVLESTANSFYHALVLQASRRLSRNVAFNAHYTFSKAMDEVTDFNSDWQPHDQLNARAERALSSFHQKHRFVFNGLFESPWTPGSGRSLAENVFGGFVLSPVVVASSGRPFNVLAGFDNLGDNHPTTHRPLRAGRNIGRGPDYFTLDLRLTRRFPFGTDSRRNVEFTAEGFNLLNRTNFKSINNTVGAVTLEELPSPLVGRRDSPTSPLAFTSAFDPRQFQFGLKVNF
jgi:hypothetical protein